MNKLKNKNSIYIDTEGRKMLYLNQKKLIGKGLFGKYFQLSKNKGVKIFGRGFLSKERVINSKQMTNAIKEASLLKISEKSNLSPKFYSVTIAKYKNKFYPAIVMQHINGTNAIELWEKHGSFSIKKGKLSLSPKGQEPAKFAKKVLLKNKINHKDLHYNNIIVTKKNNIKVIDFSPSWVQFTGNKSKLDNIFDCIYFDFLNQNNLELIQD